jgi:hypothetical protein
MLAKCAEAGAWRVAFPERFGGFYAPEEFERVRSESPAESEATASRKAAYAKATAGASDVRDAVVIDEASPAAPALGEDARALLLAELDEQAEVLGRTVADLCSRWSASRDGRDISTATVDELADHVHRIRPYVMQALQDANRDDEARHYEAAPAVGTVHELFGRGPAIPEPVVTEESPS